MEVIGCDRLSVSFPAAGFNPDQTAWTTKKTHAPGTPMESETWGGSVVVEDVKCFVGVSYIPATSTWHGKVEFNPSRVMDPEGWSTASFADSLTALGAVVDAAAVELVAPAVAGTDEMRVKRVDIARDFDVDRAEFFLSGLVNVPRPWARQSHLFNDAKAFGAQTLMVGSGAGMVRLYDKCAQTEGAAPPGTLRWEAQCRDAWADRYGEVERVSDLGDVDKVAALVANRWEWSGMGIEVSARQRVIEVVQRSGLSPREQVSFLGWLTLAAEGIGTPTSHTTLAKYRRLVRELGVTMRPEEIDKATQFTARLDFISGREVLSA